MSVFMCYMSDCYPRHRNLPESSGVPIVCGWSISPCPDSIVILRIIINYSSSPYGKLQKYLVRESTVMLKLICKPKNSFQEFDPSCFTADPVAPTAGRSVRGKVFLCVAICCCGWGRFWIGLELVRGWFGVGSVGFLAGSATSALTSASLVEGVLSELGMSSWSV